MKDFKSQAGFTILEMVCAVGIVSILCGAYFLLVDSYRDRRMNEQAAKALMLAARAQEEYFTREHHYFDAELSGNGGEAYLITPDGKKTDVMVPPRVVLSLKSLGKDKTSFTGQAFYSGGKVVHRYDSQTGKMSTSERSQGET
jgi:prepilin-type N-terminal cleavage/methylation domain-containing protein